MPEDGINLVEWDELSQQQEQEQEQKQKRSGAEPVQGNGHDSAPSARTRAAHELVQVNDDNEREAGE